MARPEGIPLSGEMSRSDKGVGRERSGRVPRTRSSPLQKSAKKRTGKPVLLNGAPGGLFPCQGKCHEVTKGLGGSEADAYLEPVRVRSKKVQKKRTGKPVLLNGAPGGTRTPDLLVRSQSLYPAELRAHI